jgi:hypothetical protein
MIRSFKIFLILCFAGIGSIAHSQSTDLARIEYTYFPQSISDNAFRRFKSFVNFPIKLNDKGAYLVPGVEYQYINFDYEDPALFNTSELQKFQSYTFNLGFTFKISEAWRFGTEGGVKVASNFERKEIITDDLIYTGAIYLILTIENERFIEPTRLILGLEYSTTTGIPFPLPVINYYKRFDPKWSYSLGVPKTNLKYYFNDKNSMQGFITLDGFFSNVQDNFEISPDNPNSNALAESVSMRIMLSGLGYEYNLTKHISFYIYGGHTIINDIRLRDGNLDKVYTINNKNAFYVRAGLKFNIL